MERSHVVLPTVREFGIYTRKGEKRMIGDTNAVENSVTLYSGPFTFEQITRDIPARLNTSFGFRYQLSGLPPLGKTNVQCVVTHPEITNANGKVTTTTAWKTTVVADTNGVVQGLMGYAFQKPYEMVLGRWVMHLYMDNKIQLRVSFNVTAD